MRAINLLIGSLLVLIALVVSLGCINLPFFSRPSTTTTTTTPVTYVSTSVFTTNYVPTTQVSFIKYAVLKPTEQTLDLASIPFRDIPLSLGSINIIEETNWPQGESYPVLLAFKIEVENAPDNLEINCTLHRKGLVGVSNKKFDTQIYCKGDGCKGKYVEPTVIDDTIETSNNDYLEGIYYLECKLKNVPFYRYIVVTKDREVLKAIPNSFSIIEAKIKNLIKNAYEFPTGLGPLRFQLYILPDYLASQYGVDGNIYWYVTNTPKKKTSYLRIGNLIEKDEFSGFGVYIDNNNPIKVVCNPLILLDNSNSPTTSADIKPFESKIDYNCRVLADDSKNCNVDTKAKEFTISSNNKLYLEKTGGEFIPIAKGLVTIDNNNINYDKYAIVLINCSYSYTVRIPLVRVKIQTIKEE